MEYNKSQNRLFNFISLLINNVIINIKKNIIKGTKLLVIQIKRTLFNKLIVF